MLNRTAFDITHHGHIFHCAGDSSFNLDRPLVCITGTRRATPYGLALAKQTAEIVAKSGYAILTTASIGCSAAAARGALDEGAEVVVISGSGCNTSYPSVCQDILERANLIISLQEPNDRPTRHAFQARDAVIPSLADKLIVCECGMPSGVFSLSDKMLAIGKQVFAYPGSVFSPESRGSNALIKAGATMLSSPHDLESLLGCITGHATSSPITDDPVLQAIVANPSRVDELAYALDTTALDVLRHLADLEVNGFAQRLPDGRYAYVPQP